MRIIDEGTIGRSISSLILTYVTGRNRLLLCVLVRDAAVILERSSGLNVTCPSRVHLREVRQAGGCALFAAFQQPLILCVVGACAISPAWRGTYRDFSARCRWLAWPT